MSDQRGGTRRMFPFGHSPDHGQADGPSSNGLSFGDKRIFLSCLSFFCDKEESGLELPHVS